LNPTLWFNQPDPDPQNPDPEPTDPLTSFHYDTQNSTYTSDMVQNWTRFGYTYDNLVPPSKPASESDAVQLERLLAVQPQSVSVSHATAAAHHSTLKRTLKGLYGNTRKDLLNAPGIHGLKNDYIINIVYDR
jgi:hypothetical protein